MILVWLLIILISSSLLAFLFAGVNNALPRWIALISMLGCFFISLFLWMSYYATSEIAGPAWIIDFQRNWIPEFGITFHLAIDGLSLLLLILTFFLGILAVVCSWREINDKVGFYHFNLLWIVAGIVGVFMAMDLFLFYFFWEVMLIPMYFLIGIWGSENREYASYKFFIFTQASGLMMLLAIIGLYFIHGQNTGVYTFDYNALLGTEFSSATGLLLMLGFMIAFVVKLPVIPFHTWLADAHSEAPTAGSLILAGLLLKTGAYGILRFAVPLFPDAALEIAPWAMVLGVAGIIYGAILAFSQTDFKRLVAYTSVSHMGFVIVGIFAFNELALQGVVMQLVTHGISTGALFILAGMLKERLHTRDINLMGGLWKNMPAMGGMGLLFAMASLGLPGLGNFIAEFLILLGTYQANIWIAVIATFGLVFSAIYSLRIMQKVFLGPARNLQTDPPVVKDFSWREFSLMAVLSVSIIWLGLYPQPIINTTKSMVTHLKNEMLMTKGNHETKKLNKDKIYTQEDSEIK